MFDIVYQLIKNKQFVEAKKNLEELLQSKPDRAQTVEIYKLLFKVAILMDNPSEGLNHAILLKQKYSVDIFNKLFIFYIEKQQFKELIDTLKARFAIDKNEKNLEESIKQLKGKYDISESYFDELIKEESNGLLDMESDMFANQNDSIVSEKTTSIKNNKKNSIEKEIRQAQSIEIIEPTVERENISEFVNLSTKKQPKKSVIKKIMVSIGVVGISLMALIIWVTTLVDDEVSNVNQGQLTTEANPSAINNEEEKKSEDSSNVQVETQIAKLIEGYLNSYSAGDTYALSDYVDMNSSFYREQVAYMQSLKDRGITVYLNDHKIQQIHQVDDESYEIIVNESYDIDNPSAAIKTVTQRVKYVCAYENDQFYIINMLLL